MHVIDLLSDAVTRPSRAMLGAMVAHAPMVIHSMRDEDPAVRAIERRAAELTGKEAAVFVPTGTMANQVAVRAWCVGVPAPLVVAEARAHLIEHEGGGAALHAGAELRAIHGERGRMPIAALAAALAPAPRVTALLHPQPALVVVENTHNFAGGVALPLDHMREVHDAARAANVPVHLDGARVFNAALALSTSPRALADQAESVMFSLTKGLGAPYGALLAGNAEFIERARRFKQVMGGGVYKAGILAAAGLVALDEGVARLPDDHAHAKLLAAAMRRAGLAIADPDTNIVVADVSPLGVTAHAFEEHVRAQGVRVAAISAREVRAVTHKDVSREECERAAAALGAVVEALRKRA
ncbi:MAG: threonine aldolase family protein [Thermoplasmatota archaeon]